MINPGELIFCVDYKNVPINPFPRNIAHRDHVWHRASDIWVVDPSRKNVLCHRRSANKDTHPSLFDSTFGGHLLADETPDKNAERELAEEIGVRVDHSCLNFVGIVPLIKQFEYQIVTYISCQMISRH